MPNVYVLGAGASYDAGIPLTKDILTMIKQEKPDIHEEPLQISTISMIILHSYLKEISSSPFLNMLDIEDLLSLTHFPVIFKELTGWDDDKRLKFQRHLTWGIIYIINKCNESPQNSVLYNNFIKIFSEEDSIISLNYDLLIEDLIIERFNRINYNLDISMFVDGGISDQYYDGVFATP